MDAGRPPRTDAGGLPQPQGRAGRAAVGGPGPQPDPGQPVGLDPARALPGRDRRHRRRARARSTRTSWCRPFSRGARSRATVSITCWWTGRPCRSTRPSSRATPCSATATATCRTTWRRRPRGRIRGTRRSSGSCSPTSVATASDASVALRGNVCCVVDAETQADLDRFAEQLQAAARRRQALPVPQRSEPADRARPPAAAAGAARTRCATTSAAAGQGR